MLLDVGYCEGLRQRARRSLWRRTADCSSSVWVAFHRLATCALKPVPPLRLGSQMFFSTEKSSGDIGLLGCTNAAGVACFPFPEASRSTHAPEDMRETLAQQCKSSLICYSSNSFSRLLPSSSRNKLHSASARSAHSSQPHVSAQSLINVSFSRIIAASNPVLSAEDCEMFVWWL